MVRGAEWSQVIDLILALFVSLSSDCTPSAALHELAHRVCEIAVYEALAPDTLDDAIDARAEPMAELLCRNW